MSGRDEDDSSIDYSQSRSVWVCEKEKKWNRNKEKMEIVIEEIDDRDDELGEERQSEG